PATTSGSSSTPFALLFSNYPPTPHIYPLSLHDALPISHRAGRRPAAWCSAPGDDAVRRAAAGGPLHGAGLGGCTRPGPRDQGREDRKSTRLNSSHGSISYAVFCLKKKTEKRASRDAQEK